MFCCLVKISERQFLGWMFLSRHSSVCQDNVRIFSRVDSDKKLIRTGKAPYVGKVLAKWALIPRDGDAPVSIQLAMSKAKKLKKPDFKATAGWFQRLKVRSGMGAYAATARRRVHLATVLLRFQLFIDSCIPVFG